MRPHVVNDLAKDSELPESTIENVSKPVRNGRMVVPIVCTRWFPSSPDSGFLKSSNEAARRFRRGDSAYPDSLFRDATSNLEIPFFGLTIATHLKRDGFRPEIIDLHLEISPRHRIEQRRDDIQCVGIEFQFSFSYAEASAIGRSLRKFLPETPLLWFGFASTLFAEKLCEEGLADIVIRGLPEATFCETVRTLHEKLPLNSVAGITYRDSAGAVVSNPNRRLAHHEDVLPPDYTILPAKHYSLARGHIICRTSVGCSCSCQFCPYPMIYGKDYIDLPAERVIEELSNLKKRYGLKSVTFNDQSFFEKRERVEEICEGLIRRELDIKWRASGQINFFYRFPDEFLEILGRSGCNEIHMGIESGSERLMKIQKKPFTREMILSTAERLERVGIRMVTNFIFGLPGETMEDLTASWDMIHKLREIQPDLGVVCNHYTCVPGTMQYERLRAEGGLEDHTPEAKDMDSWARFTRNMGKPWFVSRYPNRIALFYHIIAFDEDRLSSGLCNSNLRYVYPFLRRYALWRIEHRFYGFALDYYIAECLYKIRIVRWWRRVHGMNSWR